MCVYQIRKQTVENINKPKDSIIYKLYAKYKLHEILEKSEMAGRASGKHVVNLHTHKISHIVNYWKLEIVLLFMIKWLSQLAFLVRTLGDFLVPLLVAAHTFDNEIAGFINEAVTF